MKRKKRKVWDWHAHDASGFCVATVVAGTEAAAKKALRQYGSVKVTRGSEVSIT